ncbi:MAG: class I SAM-dependent RNA methyltransferase [Chloroflexi bacterium]|nr:class I SAM-dependent RNA methyltransferase [Chloroflexota bacterium]
MDQVELTLTGIAHGGSAVGRLDGRVFFVTYALPGETVIAQIDEDRERYVLAHLVEVLDASPNRVGAPCPYFGVAGCGGCQWQHISYSTQLELKSEIVCDQLMRIGRVAAPTVLPTLPDSSGWGYRNNAQFTPALGNGLGFQAASSHDVIAVDKCLVLHSLLSDLYTALDIDLEGLTRLSLRCGAESGDRMLIFETEDDFPPALEVDLPISCVLLLSDGIHVNLIGHNHIIETVMGHTYHVSAPSFFQVNTPQASRLVEIVLERLNLRGSETVLDAYCGVGLFATHLAEQASLVIGVESASTAVEDLIQNSVNFDNVEIIEGPTELVLPELDIELDAAIVDPPRTGLDRFALDALADLHPERLVYVSCDPATLARDIQRLTKKGYGLVDVQPVDMFPQTHHIECVASLVAR